MSEEQSPYKSEENHGHDIDKKGQKVTLNLQSINMYLMVILLAILLFSVYALFDVNKQFEEIKPIEPPKPAELLVTVITAPDCETCLAAEVFTGAIRQLPLVNITEKIIEHGAESQELVSKYGITKLPAVIVTGEVDNVTITTFEKKDDAYVLTEMPPPYYDLDEQKVIGEVKITYITDQACELCFDITQFTSQLTQLGVAVAEQKVVDFTSHEGIALIDKYSIEKVPTMVMSDDSLQYDLVAQVWDQVGTNEGDGMLVMREVSPPYRNLDTRRVEGMVGLTLLYDETCEECYNASMHELVLQQSFGMRLKSTKIVEISSTAGKKMVEDYSITLVPTMILDKEALAYTNFEDAWEPVGTKESDGSYVFREVGLLQGVQYKDLSTGEILSAQG